MKGPQVEFGAEACPHLLDRKSTRLNSSHLVISYAVFCLKKYSSVQADRRSLVDSQHDSLRICRIDPNAVIVISTRRAFYRRKRAPAVRRTVQALRRHIDN